VPCPRCGRENNPGSDVCEHCGAGLDGGTELPAYARRSPRDYTPPFLWESVLKRHSTLEGENKLVTVLFADVVNFTATAEKLDPEDVHDIMDGCFEILGEEIHSAGGTINQYTGDGVMALFGAPIAHEDHVRGACHAALQVRARLKRYGQRLSDRYHISFQMRIGIHTGSVVVGAIGDNLRLDYTAVGDTTNLASRLQALAPPGEILVSERVWESAKQDFLFREVGLLEVKGKTKHVRAFILADRLEGVELHMRVEETVAFVDRREALSSLRQAFDRALHAGPLLVSVTGEAGIGKTRLLRAFKESLEEEAALFLEGQCRSYGQAIAFHPLMGMFKTYFNLSEQDALEEAKAKIQRRLKQKSFMAPLEQVLRFFDQIRGEDKGSDIVVQGKKRTLFRRLRDLALSVSSTRPVILVLDDMQWVDATTREFLAFLIQSSKKAPMLIICLSRTDPGLWCPGIPNDLVRLKPLSETESSALLSSVLGTDRLDPQISEEIISNADGNPLFLLEMGETLKRQELVVCDTDKCTLRLPLKDLKVPDTVHGVLAARLDALPEDQKRLVQLASIIGREFSRDLLVPLFEEADALAQGLKPLEAEGIFERLSPPEVGRYHFRHQLMREVAYHSLLRRDRRRYHRLVGETIEKAYGGNLEDQMGFLAYHFSQAQDWPKAFLYTMEAAHQARRSYACQEAHTWYDQALGILSRGALSVQEETVLRIYDWKGSMHFCMGQLKAAHAAFKSMLTEAKRSGNRRYEGEALFRIGWVSFYMHRPRVSESFLKKALDLAGKERLEEILPKASGFLGFVYAVLGKLKDARPLLLEAVRLSERQGGIEGRAWSVAYLLQYDNWIGDFHKALELSQELQRLNQEIKSPNFNILLHFRQGLIYGALGRLGEAKKSLEAGMKQLEVGDDRFWHPRFLNTLGWVLAEQGRLQEALELNRQSLREALSIGDPETINNARINLGENFLQMGRLPDARQVLEETWEQVKKGGISYTRWRYKTRLVIALGELYSRLNEREKAMTFIKNGIRLARKSGAKKHLARALFVKGKALAGYRPGQARRAFEEALHLAREMGTRLLSASVTQALEAIPSHARG
jgi:class 3 adenylate cyclase/tetratricopeptide (TPR) repeat protein